MSCIVFIIIFNMHKTQIRLNQIVSSEQIKAKRRGELHKVSNSLKRNITHQHVESERNTHYYECRLPEVGFSRKDLSLILKYLMFKEQLQVADRNLLRRILLANFEESIIAAGTKKFIHFLKMLQGNGKIEPKGVNRFYFLLKGRGMVRSGECEYQIKSGSIFGQAEIITGIAISQILFEANYILLYLQESDFNTFYRTSFQKKYSELQAKLRCIKQAYLSKIPEIVRYLFLSSIYEKIFTAGQIIIKGGQKVTQIFFVNLGQKMGHSLSCESCFGLHQTVKSQPFYAETVKCKNKRICLPCVKVEDFKRFVLDFTHSNISICGENNSGMGQDINLSCLSLQMNEAQQKPLLNSFMRVKKVRLPNSHLRSRQTTQPTSVFEASFQFLRPQRLNSNFKSRQRQSRHQRYKSSMQNRSIKSLLSSDI